MTLATNLYAIGKGLYAFITNRYSKDYDHPTRITAKNALLFTPHSTEWLHAALH